MTNQSRNRLWFSPILFIITVIIVSIERTYSELTEASYQESITGLSLISGGPSLVYPDNTILLRLGRLDPTNSDGNCNEAKILFRAVVAGYNEIVPYELDVAGNTRIPIDCFCAPSPKKKKRFIFDDNYRREVHHDNRRISLYHRDHFRKRTPQAPGAAPGTPPPPAGGAPAPPPPGGAPTPKDGTPPPPAGGAPAPPSPGGAPAPPKDGTLPPPGGAPGAPAAPSPPPSPKAVADKINILTFHNDFVLLYYPCGVQNCGDIYSIKNIKVRKAAIILPGECDETNAVNGVDGFLFLCYRSVSSSILWESWSTDGNTVFAKAFSGSISNVTVPNEAQSENFSGGLFKVFSTGSKTYSIIMGSFSNKLDLKSNIYSPPIDIYAYFLADQTIISGPFSIYQNIENNGGTIQFQIQTCHSEIGGPGYKCLITVRLGELDQYTKYVAISFSSSGEVIGKNEFYIQHEPKAKTPATLNLNYGGWCIGVVSAATGLDCLAYDEKGNYNGEWGIPKGLYDSVGSAPNNIMWAVLPFTTNSIAMSWKIYFTDKLMNFKPNVQG